MVNSSRWNICHHCRAQNCNLESFSLTTLSSMSRLLVRQHAGEVNVSLFTVGLCCRDGAKAVADRRQSLPSPTTAGPAAPQAAAAPHGFGPALLDSGVSVVRQLANLLLIVKPETVLRWHRQGWRSYWRRRSSRGGKTGRPPIAPELRTLIRRMSMENRVWGQRRIQAELARLGFKVSARTIAKYMHPIHRRGPSSRWRSFLRQPASAIWACDFFLARPKRLAMS